MSEEVTYADLKFQNSSERENIQVFYKLEEKAPPAPSYVWRQRALCLTLLCLLLLTALGVLASMFYVTLKIEMEKTNELQNVKEELQSNISLHLMNITDSSQKIRNLSITLQNIATRLCYELYKKEPEHKCKPCPKNWRWHKDMCYSLSSELQTWQESEVICSGQNASLLTIKDKSVLDFIKSLSSYHYWLGLSPKKDYTYVKNLGEIINSSDWFIGNTDHSNKKFCGYIYGMNVYYAYCMGRKGYICEKMADSVKTESTLTNEVEDGS
ncbi:C-type lectin domain family 12 member A [Tupaia chinensis]|uniref:C-type lectin domain family 12 member A n=1 Tax=Tupaia chinensis TaxID=246437 RepID=UPI0003C9144A|nr:C-type lectin domain family 12 member A [Tupaia chinensis]